MKKVVHEIKGRKYLVALPEGVDNTDLGIFIGPPEFVDQMNLPEPFATRLHNQMFDRKLFTLADIQKRSHEIEAALKAALRVDMMTIMQAYNESEKETIPFD